jgi:hypothetical protein
MFVTADQLVAHAIGDYLLQSDWMANEKTKRSLAAALHAITYAIPFLWLRPSWAALAVIVGTHFLIDRWRLARFVVWAKNYSAPWTLQKCDTREVAAGVIRNVRDKFSVIFFGRYVLACQNPPWRECTATGYAPDRPPWLAVWLLIIADNVLHVLCNAAALAYLNG